VNRTIERFNLSGKTSANIGEVHELINKDRKVEAIAVIVKVSKSKVTYEVLAEGS